MIRLNIDGFEVTGYEGQTLLEAARANGIHIPTLCHDERVAPQGACGLCLVEAEGIPKLLRACATEIMPGMIVNTRSPRVVSARKTALELLLSTHTGDCKPPCMLACPAHTDCQGYIGLIANGQYTEAVKLMKEAHPLPASIGRVCPHPCEDECRRQLCEEPLNIAALKYFAADRDLYAAENAYVPPSLPETGKSAAVVGGGPAGLTAAYFLKRAGHKVVLYDSMPAMGGLLRYGIPEYRLPKAVLDREIDILAQMGIVFVNGISLGKDISLDFLRGQFDAVVIATGAGMSKKMRCPGEDLRGVLGGIDFLKDAAMHKPVVLGEKVVVVGGSNTAMDAARTAVRLGVPEVYVVYRRSREEMPAEPEEIKEAEAEGVIFKFLVNPIAIIGSDGKAEKVRLQKMMLGAPDAGGRRAPVPVKGEEEVLDADTVIAAIGQDVNLSGLASLTVTNKNTLLVDEASFYTGTPGVFAIGDVTGKSAYAIEAIGHARTAVKAVNAWLNTSQPDKSGKPAIAWDDIPDVLVKDTKSKEDFQDEPIRPRVNVVKRAAADVKDSFIEISRGLSAEQAMNEAKRCLACGCGDFYECKLLYYANEYGADPEAYHNCDQNCDQTIEKPKHAKDESSPYFSRNPDKCLLCGLCVRVCDEVMGLTALGVMNRGFQAQVSPAFGKPIHETDCIACGQCVTLCPTGALQEKLPLEKTLAVHEEITDTVCGFCSVGCLTRLTSKGTLLLRALPGDTDKKSLLCVRGRFGFGQLNHINRQGERLKTPLVKVNGQLTETTYPFAFDTIRTRISQITALYGPAAIGVAISDRYTLEDMYVIREYARKVIGTPHVFSFNGVKSGLGEVTGRDASTNCFDELSGTEVIVLIANNIMRTHTIAGLKIKQAVQCGAKLILIDSGESQADEWAHIKINPGNDLHVLRVFVKAVMDATNNMNADGYDALRDYLSAVKPDGLIEQAALLYAGAKHAMIVYDQHALSVSASRLMADMAVLSGHIAKPRAGVIQLKPNNNSQGLSDLNINTDAALYTDMIRSKMLRGLFVFGEDIPLLDSLSDSSLAFLCVQDAVMTEIAQKADVVLPSTVFSENTGYYTDTTRHMKKADAAIPSAIGLQNWQLIVALANGALPFTDAADILMAMKDTYPATADLEPVLHRNGFAFPDGRATLQIPDDDVMYMERLNTNFLHRSFIQTQPGAPV